MMEEIDQLAAGWTKADWEHYRLLSLALSLEAERANIGELIFEQRSEQGFSRKQIGKLIGISKRTMKRIELGKADPALSVLHSLFEILGIRANYSVM